ncbi:ATP-binding protein, partial [candidate division KSB1 bacterium]|nr:ATP-binding protein [candidate division KSB1 bacterium]
DDLYQYLDEGKNYILFIDDANRISEFNQILGFFKTIRTGRLIIVVTVRDYAFRDLYVLCQGYNPCRLDLYKLTDKQITDIIKEEPFKILKYNYQIEILRIADGNPKLAIMASLLVLEENNIYVLSNVFSLFEKYFLIFINDQNELANDFNIKCLGIVSFFHTLPYKNKTIITLILDNFDLGYSEFIDAIDLLNKLELVEIQFEYIKIPEQNLATYFFFRTFIKDDLLSFGILLEKYFKNNVSRFKDCVIPANNMFGPKKVREKLVPDLKKYWKSIRNEHDIAYKFLTVFWYYLKPEVFEYIYEIIENLPETMIDEYDAKYEEKTALYKNQILELICEFWGSSLDLKDALELAFEYVRKLPEYVPDLIQKIKEILIFDREDERNGFARQQILFDLIIQKFENADKLYVTVFYELAKIFMSFKFYHVKADRGYAYTWYYYSTTNKKPIQDFRARIWDTLNTYFPSNPEESFKFFNSYSTIVPDVTKDIIEFDIPYIIHMIDRNFTVDSFEHCQYVQSLIKMWKQNSISHSSLNDLEQRFTNSTYKMFLIIDWDWVRDKDIYNFKDHNDYRKVKEAEIHSAFIFESKEDIIAFYQSFVQIRNKVKNEDGLHNSLDLIIDANAAQKFENGIFLLQVIIEKNNEINFIPKIVFQNHLLTEEKTNNIWQLIERSFFCNKALWTLYFFYYLDESLIHKGHCGSILEALTNIKKTHIIDIDRLKKYLKLCPTLFENIMKIVVQKNNKDQTSIYLWEEIFSVYLNKLGDDIELVKEAYLQQCQIFPVFDNSGEGFVTILKKDPTFLIDFVRNQSSLSGKKFSGYGRTMEFIWKVENIEEQLEKVFEIVIQEEPFVGIVEHFCNVFFRNLTDQEKKRADYFLMSYVSKNSKDPRKISVVVDIVRRSRKEKFEALLLRYISLNHDRDTFSKILWIETGRTLSDHEILGDFEAAGWRYILSIVEKSDLGIELIPIKKYIDEKIDSCHRDADWERRMKFLEKDK